MDVAIDLRLEPYSNLYLASSTCGGKTFICCQLVLNRQSLYKIPVDGCIYYYKHHQKIFDDVKEKDDEVQFVNDIEVLKSLISAEHTNYLIIWDDFLLDGLYEETKFITEWFMVTNHHFNCSTVFQSQLLFPKNLKSLTLNSAYIVLLKSNNLSQIQHFLRQIEPIKWRSLVAIYNEIVDNEDYGMFVLNLHARTNKRLRYRNFILARPGAKVYTLK